MKFIPCKICGKSQIQHEQIFLTDDGYCTVCNHKFKNRPRIKPLFNFVYDKSTKYDHLTHLGSRRTKDYDIKQKLYKENNAIPAGTKYQEYLKNKNKKIDEFLNKPGSG